MFKTVTFNEYAKILKWSRQLDFVGKLVCVQDSTNKLAAFFVVMQQIRMKVLIYLFYVCFMFCILYVEAQ